MSLLTLFTGHHTSWERAIIISLPGNATRRPLNKLQGRLLEIAVNGVCTPIDYCVVYEIDDRMLFILAVGHRHEIYCRK